MSLLKINSLAMGYSGRELLENIQAQINTCNHIGLVGPNGVGKTTLLRLMMGQLEPTAGHISRMPGLRIGYLEQQPEFPAGHTVFAEVYEGLGDLKSIEDKLHATARSLDSADSRDEVMMNRLATRYAELSDQYETLGGSSAEARVEAMLAGIGVPRRLWNSTMESLSGGERNVIGLARILIGRHDLLLLDEPGNHLDFSGLEWLENLLCNSKQAFVIVSHNRYLLDRICTGIWEIERHKLSVYTGNYSDYRAQKLAEQLRREMEYQRQQKLIQRLEFNIRRLKSWGQVYDNAKLLKTAKVMERRIEKMDKVERITEGKKLKFRFLTEPPKGDIALDVKGYTLQFDDLPALLRDVSFLVSKGERVAMVGNNGTGKSTLLKEVIHDGRWEHPVLRIGKSVRIGYYSQLGENLSNSGTLVEEAMRLTGLLRGGASELLYRFLFTNDDLEKPVAVLSGGEKARLQLAILVYSGADMLLLDEPTNHLDIPSREAVEDALEEYPGTLLFVSHDRYFLDKLADRVLHFVPPEVVQYEGNFTEFWEKHKHRISAAKPLGHSPLDRDAELSNKESKHRAKRIKYDPQRFKWLETEIARLEQLRLPIEEEMRKFLDKGKETLAARRRERLVKLDEQIAELYEEWIEIGERKRKN